MINNLLDNYDNSHNIFKAYSQSMERLVNALIDTSSIKPHSVSCRVKTRHSLSKKIDKKEKYSSIHEITDIVGLRIITNYSDEVDKIAEIIEEEFSIDHDNSIDKRASLDPDRFGYLSLHYVASLKQERKTLVEYQRFKNLKFEIQIRSILQHTWAEIEHDIGYKSKIEIPKPIRRKFSRLAGLLELADDQFIQIRDDLENYEENIQNTISSSPDTIEIDTVSVFEYINSSKLLKELDEKVAKLAPLRIRPITKENAAKHIKYLKYLGIKSVSDLEANLKENSALIIKRATDAEGDNSEVSQGLSIFYLHQVLAGKKHDENEVVAFLDKMEMTLSHEREDFAKYLVKLCQ